MDNNKILAKQLLNYSINIKENEKLLIELFGEDGLPLLEEIKRQAESLNVKVLTNIINYENLKAFIINSIEQEMINYSNKDLERMKSVYSYIGISAKTKDNEFENVPLEKMANFYQKI